MGEVDHGEDAAIEGIGRIERKKIKRKEQWKIQDNKKITIDLE